MLFQYILPKLSIYILIVSTCEKGLSPYRTTHLLQEMPLKGLLPEMITYSAWISACGEGA